MDRPKAGLTTGPKTGPDREVAATEAPAAPGAEGAAPAPETAALFRPGREIQRLAEDWVALRRDAFLLDQKLRSVEARLTGIEGRSTGDAHAKLALLAQVLRHELGLAPDHRAVRLASSALAALECVHLAVESAGAGERPSR